MKKITGYKTFFAELDKIEADMEAFRIEQKEKFKDTDTFFCHFAETNNDSGKIAHKAWKVNKHLHINEKRPCEVNGEIRFYYPSVYLWFTLSNYKGKASYDETYEKSEKIKVIHSEKGYEFCLIRMNLQHPTDTYWGYKWAKHTFAVMHKGKIVYNVTERWQLENLCENGIVKFREPETPTEIFRYFNPFKLLIVPFEDKKYTKKSLDRYGLHSHNEPHAIIDYFEKNYAYHTERKNLWIVHIMGMGRFCEKYLDKHITTWWIINSKTKPTQDEALDILMRELDIYDREDFAELLVHLRDELGTDLNKINILAEQRIMDLYKRKLIGTLEQLMDTRYKEIKKYYDEHVTF